MQIINLNPLNFNLGGFFMSSGTDPPVYVAFEVFDDNLEKFRDDKTLSECVRDWLNLQFDSLPFVLSPLHKPKGSKEHIHGIIELSPYQPITFNKFADTFKVFNLPRPEICNNVCSMELYLTHDTPQSRIDEKQKFTVAERATMIFANGYKLHKQTARDKADDISLVVNYISDKLYDYINEHIYFDIDDLYSLVKSPKFYNGLETSLPVDLVISKGKNEVKTHFRFYLQLASDLKHKMSKNPVCTEKEFFCDSVISNFLSGKQDFMLQRLHYACWSNFPKYRDLLSKNGFSHSSYGHNLRFAVSYFKSYDNDMTVIYNIFLDVINNSK